MKIDHILSLAKLKIKGREKQELEKEFSSILNFVESLRELDIQNVKPMSYPTEIKNVFREDKTSKTPANHQQAKKLLDSAPETQGKYIKVRQIL